MQTSDLARPLAGLFSEVVNGTDPGGGFILNTGDAGLLRSLETLSAADASQSANGGATIAAHVQHVRYGLSLMNRWASEGGNPFADATWNLAWNIHTVDTSTWDEIRRGLKTEAERWITALHTPREISELELKGMIASVGHIAYHLGAIRQIAKQARGPREGTFS